MMMMTMIMMVMKDDDAAPAAADCWMMMIMMAVMIFQVIRDRRKEAEGIYGKKEKLKSGTRMLWKFRIIRLQFGSFHCIYVLYTSLKFLCNCITTEQRH
ncbi:hypothetical protein ElyMa_005511800 [Elysia marginata]|uniref:Uncharacterized protein n=1 Tax=Elysia marginata TaxID=1093978 RepID=A0AAV4EW10_9GAST|nr:hypothetical protein ElyMa_005511800 [Elysia marginata]